MFDVDTPKFRAAACLFAFVTAAGVILARLMYAAERGPRNRAAGGFPVVKADDGDAEGRGGRS